MRVVFTFSEHYDAVDGHGYLVTDEKGEHKGFGTSFPAMLRAFATRAEKIREHEALDQVAIALTQGTYPANTLDDWPAEVDQEKVVLVSADAMGGSDG